MATTTFTFTSSTVDRLLDQVRNTTPHATPFDLLASLFWTRIARLKPSKEKNQSLCICTDFRRLLHPSLPLGYFGNALHFSSLALSEEERLLVDHGELGGVVELVHRHVSGIDQEAVRSSMEWLESWKKGGGSWFPMYGSHGLTCVSMEHMVMEDGESLAYGVGFEGDERPVRVGCHVGNVEGEGLIIVMPSRDGGLGRTVVVTLPAEELAKLDV